ncbi:MAG: hypothetical protein ACXVAO_07555 [Vulcanimicrobiaceae bacterium]
MTTSTLTRFACIALLASVALAGCGGGKSTNTTATTTTQSSAAPQAVPTTEAQREAAALPQSVMEPVPAALNCGAVKPVWVNLRTKAYHEPADPYYGRTKYGKYMCPSAAQAAGFHPAGRKNGSSSMNGAMNGSTSSNGMTSSGKHHRKSSSMEMMGPSPEPT